MEPEASTQTSIDILVTPLDGERAINGGQSYPSHDGKFTRMSRSTPLIRKGFPHHTARLCALAR
jgi:hypothetical protein